MRSFQRWWPSLTADPGLVRLSYATRACWGTIAAWLGFWLISHWIDRSASAVIPSMFAGFIGFLASSVVNDPTPTAQRRTTLLLVPTAMLVTLLGTLTHSLVWLNNALLLLVCFLAFELRRYGTQFIGIGMMGLIGFLFASLMKQPVEELPRLFVALLIGVGSAYLFRFVLWPANPQRVQQQMLIQFRQQMAIALAYLTDALVEGSWTTVTWQQARHYFNQLHTSMRGIEQQLTQSQFPESIGHLRIAIFNSRQSLSVMLEAVPRLVTECLPPAEVKQALVTTLQTLHGQMITPQGSPAEVLASLDHLWQVLQRTAQPDQDVWVFAILRLHRAIAELVEDLPQLDLLSDNLPPMSENSLRQKPQINLAPARLKPRAASWSSPLNQHPGRILAIQATLAGGVAMFLSGILSLEQPYWATLTAILLISSTVGETFKRSVERFLGTVGGAILGVVLASLLPSSAFLLLACLFVSVFLTAYTLSISYPLMIFWLTTGLMLLFAALGGLHPDLALWRIVDTLVGAGIGLSIAILVMPTATVRPFKLMVRDLLVNIDDLVREAIAALQGGSPQIDFAQACQDNLQQIQTIATRLEALRYESWLRRYSYERFNHWQTLLRAANHYASQLATEVSGLDKTCTPDRTAILTLPQAQLHTNLQSLITALSGGSLTPLTDLPDLHNPLHPIIDFPSLLMQEDSSGGLTLSNCLYYLDRLNAVLFDLARDLQSS